MRGCRGLDGHVMCDVGGWGGKGFSSALAAAVGDGRLYALLTLGGRRRARNIVYIGWQ